MEVVLLASNCTGVKFTPVLVFFSVFSELLELLELLELSRLLERSARRKSSGSRFTQATVAFSWSYRAAGTARVPQAANASAHAGRAMSRSA